MRDCGWPAAIFSSVFVSQAWARRQVILQVPMSEAIGPTHGAFVMAREQCFFAVSFTGE